MFAADICGILIRLGHTEYATNIGGKHKYAAISMAYTSMTRVSPFENGRNQMRMSYKFPPIFPDSWSSTGAGITVPLTNAIHYFREGNSSKAFPECLL